MAGLAPFGPLIPTTPPRLAVALALLLSLPASPAAAAGGTGQYRLPWPIAGETLVYRSCGCADECWVAEVHDTASQRVKARLRCDCEKLHATYPWPGHERAVADTCSAINGQPDKSAAIGKALRQLMTRQPALRQP